jgi:hypothetical protein
LTVFDGTGEDESKLATQFWNSVVLIPPVESTLVCKEIKQRLRSRTLNDGQTKRLFKNLCVFSIIDDFFLFKRDFQRRKRKRKKRNR